MRDIKRINPVEILSFIVLVSLFSWFKCFYGSVYLSVTNVEEYLYRSLVYCEEEILLYLVWLSILFVQMYLVCKKSYLSIMNFNVRNNGRFKHFFYTIYDHFSYSILYSLILIIIQFTFLYLYMKPQLLWSFSIFWVVIKYIIEFIVLSINVTFFAVLFKNFIYSYLINLMMIIVMMFVAKNELIPFMSLFVNYHVNILSVIYVLVIVIGLYFIYRKKEFYGGVDR